MTDADATEPLQFATKEEHYAWLTQAAVEAFWNNRDLAKQKAIKKGLVNPDESAGVRGGQNHQAFNELIREVLATAKFNATGVHFNGTGLTIPGYYRFSKDWDVILKDADENVVGAIEFKSIVGGRLEPKLKKNGEPSQANSFGSNLNNRIEEAIGSASDLRGARKADFLKTNDPFFVGWVMVMEDHDDSKRAVGDPNGVYKNFPEADVDFHGSSYLKRAKLFCHRAVESGLYDATALVVTPRPKPDAKITYRDMDKDTSIKRFIEKLSAFAEEHPSKGVLF